MLDSGLHINKSFCPADSPCRAVSITCNARGSPTVALQRCSVVRLSIVLPLFDGWPPTLRAGQTGRHNQLFSGKGFFFFLGLPISVGFFGECSHSEGGMGLGRLFHDRGDFERVSLLLWLFSVVVVFVLRLT